MSLTEVGLVLYVVVWIGALIDIMRSTFRKDRYLLMWLTVVFIVPVGCFLYFLLAKRHKMASGE